MKKNLRFFSVLLAALLLVSLPCHLFLEAEATSTARAATSGTTGSCTWRLSASSLTISGKGAMADYTPEDPAPWGNGITGVILDSGVTSIGNFAFAGCTALSFANVPTTVTSIGENAFAGCTNLSYFPLSDADSLSVIGSAAFEGCTGFDIVTLPDSVVTVKAGAFRKCTALTLVNLPASLANLATDAFVGCSALKQFFVDGANAHFSSEAGMLLDQSKATLICYPAGSGTEHYTVPENVSTVGKDAFSSCEALQSIVFSQALKTIEEGAFHGCSALRDVYFAGTLTEWSLVTKGEANTPLTTATLHTGYCIGSADNEHQFDDDRDASCAHCSYRRIIVCIGDLNNDGTVSSDDAIYLLYNTLFGETRYPLNQPCDFNLDDRLSSDDAIYLLYNTLFGETRYPLS